MTKRKLKKVFSDNINKEFESFISQMEEFKKSEIIACSYRIYIMQYIYEYLMRKQEDFSKEDLKILYEQASILKDIYWEWVKNDLTDNDELNECIENTLEELFNRKGAS